MNTCLVAAGGTRHYILRLQIYYTALTIMEPFRQESVDRGGVNNMRSPVQIRGGLFVKKKKNKCQVSGVDGYIQLSKAKKALK